MSTGCEYQLHTHTHTCTHKHTHTHTQLTWIIAIRAGQEAAMMTGDPFSPSVIGHHSVLHWTVCVKEQSHQSISLLLDTYICIIY